MNSVGHRISADYHFAVFASLLTGSLSISKSLFFYRLHNENNFSRNPVVGGKFLPGEWPEGRTEILNLAILRLLEKKYHKFCGLFGHWTIRDVAKRISAVSEKQEKMFAKELPTLYRETYGLPSWVSPKSWAKLRSYKKFFGRFV